MKESGKFNYLLNLFHKYSILPLPLKSSLWFMGCNFMQRGIMMITTPVFTRILSKEEYGVVSIFSSWQVVLEIVMPLCLNACALNLYVRYEDKEKVLSSLCGIEIVLTIFWLLNYLLFAEGISNTLNMSIVLGLCMILTVMANQIIYLWTGYKRYIYDYKWVTIVTVLLTGGSSFFGVVCVLFWSSTAEGRIVPLAIITSVISIILYCTIIKKNAAFYDKEIWMFAFSYGIPLIPHYISQFILQSSDKLMINYMCGPQDVAMYSIAYSVGSLINILITAINASFIPYQYQQIKNGNYKQLSLRANQIMLIVAVFLIGIMMFSNEIILIFGGEQYLDSQYIVVPICLGVFFNYLFQIFARVQEYYLHKFTLIIASTTCAFLNFVLNYIFIQIYGYQAAAYTTFVCYFLFCFLHYLCYKSVVRRNLNGNKIYDMKGIVLASVFIILSGIMIYFFNHLIWIKYSVITVAIINFFIFREKLVVFIKILQSKK